MMAVHQKKHHKTSLFILTLLGLWGKDIKKFHLFAKYSKEIVGIRK